MLIEILYFAEFKDLTGKEKEQFKLNEGNLKELLDLLFDKYNSTQELIWDEKNQKVHNIISVIVNNQPVHEIDPSKVIFKDGDKVAFLLPVSGG
ncbi:MAG: MoaD/ThiS family protein [Promethearchaeota archaeon]|jgi:MoaD family protein